MHLFASPNVLFMTEKNTFAAVGHTRLAQAGFQRGLLKYPGEIAPIDKPYDEPARNSSARRRKVGIMRLRCQVQRECTTVDWSMHPATCGREHSCSRGRIHTSVVAHSLWPCDRSCIIPAFRPLALLFLAGLSHGLSMGVLCSGCCSKPFWNPPCISLV